MDGIILTQGVGGGSSSAPTPIETTIAAGDTELIDIFDGSSCPFMTWHVSATDNVSIIKATRFLIVSALHDFEGNADNNCYSIMGTEYNLDISITTGTPDTNIELSITNNELIALDFCVVRTVGI